MNTSRLARWTKAWDTNPIWAQIKQLRSAELFRGARFDIFSSTTNPQRLIVLLGQVHTVWSGSISNRQRQQIVRCQARLASYYDHFIHRHQVNRFGAEGLYEGIDTRFSDQQVFQLYRESEKQLKIRPGDHEQGIYAVAVRLFAHLGAKWQEALRFRHSTKLIQQLAASVSGQTLLNYWMEGQLETYPVEHQRAYQQVLKGVNQLGQQIQKLQNTQEIRFVVQRGGKATNAKEAQAVRQLNALIIRHNKLLGSDIRERATFTLLLEEVEKSSPVVFTMGIGHRRNYIKLCSEFLKGSDTAFVVVTPPELRVSWLIKLGLPILGLFLVLLLFILTS